MNLFGILGSYLFLHILGKYFNKIGKISAKIHEIGKIKAIFGLGMTPIYGIKNGQIKSLTMSDYYYLVYYYDYASLPNFPLKNILGFKNNLLWVLLLDHISSK